MDFAKQAAHSALSLIQDDQWFGIVTFNEAAEWAVSLQQAKDRSAIDKAIDQISAKGETNIGPALQDAYTALAQVQSTTKHIVLLTDGRSLPFNYEAMLDEMNKQKITLSTIAVGEGADQALLQEMAQIGHGRTYYIGTSFDPTSRYVSVPRQEYNSLPEILRREIQLSQQVHNDQAGEPRFEVVSIKIEPDIPLNSPTVVVGIACRGSNSISRSQGGTTGDRAVDAPRGHCVAERVNLGTILVFAYGTTEAPVGGPDSVHSVVDPTSTRFRPGSFFYIDAKAEDPSTVTTEWLQRMLQTMLKERFALRFHTETSDSDGYVVSLDKGGVKLKETKSTGVDDNPDLKPIIIESRADLPRWEPGWTVFKGIASMTVISHTLGGYIQDPPPKPVVDRTGVVGTYAVSFAFPRGTGRQASEELMTQLLDLRRSMAEKYLREAGLRAEPAKVPVERIVIDHAEKPSQN